MAADRTIPKLAPLSDDEITAKAETALRTLDEIGVKIVDEEVLRLLADTPGTSPDRRPGVARFSPELDQARAADA
jgi:trimethylamine:corrinoid methyltransferase-like protein